MKKITLLLFAFILTITVQAQTTLTHNTDNVITSANSVACQGGDNNFARNFILADFGVTETFTINSGEIGVQEIDLDTPVTVNVYTSDAAFPASFGSAVLLGSQSVNIPSTSGLSIVAYDFDVPVVVPAGTEAIVVEIFQEANGVAFFIGGTAAETDDSYLKSTTCGVADYVTATSIGFPDAHYYITVTGTTILGVNEALADASSIYPNPVSDILNVKLPSNVEVTSVTITDVLGRNAGIVYSNGEMNVSALAKGVYILNVNTTSGSLNQKIVKN